MDFSVKQAMKVVVVLVCAVAVIATSIVMINGDDDKIKNKNDELWNTIKELNGSGGGSESGGSGGGTNNPTFGPNGEPLVSTTESQVGKYADIDGDGTVDGIIFADLAVGGSGTWNDYDTTVGWANTQGSYVIQKQDESKAYYVSQKSYTDKLGGTAEVLTPIGTGEDRFYIMALSDISSNYYDWYNAAYNYKINNYNSITSQEFGKGKDNTATMISKWNSKAYGNQDRCNTHKDLWGQIQMQADNSWFVPSRAELAAFAKNIGVTKSNYSSKGLMRYYWSSSLYGIASAYYASISNGCISKNNVDNYGCVRLAATF